MAQNPPRTAAARQGGPASAGGAPSQSGGRPKDGGKEPPGTFFLGRYRVVDEIGVGGMASVHLARMDGPGGFQKWVAIKRIHPHLVEDDQFVDMFLDEARIAAGINHANVAQVFDLGKDDNTYWIAMEYLHGEPLREIMRRAEERKIRISPELAARICSDAAEGLHAAHELRGKNGQLLGLVHRDVTPHNLFLTYDGYTKVVDFGIAKVADRLSQTRAGTLKGKLAYMSPEQVRGAEVDRTTDIFALGVVLWELTTNQRLFRMDTDLDTLEKVQACVVPPPSSIVPDFPQELEQVILKALSKRKQDRFQTAREFSRALQNFLMRRGAFVGPEEVAQFVRHVFADRIQKREAHLAWAAEVTSTINVDQLKAGNAALPGSADELSLVGGEQAEAKRARQGGGGGPPPSAARPPGGPPTARPQGAAPGSRPLPPGGALSPPRAPAAAAPSPSTSSLAAQSLMDDDEDVPTTVATREQLEKSEALEAAKNRPAGGRPAAGAPAAGAPPQHQQPGMPGSMQPAPFGGGNNAFAPGGFGAPQGSRPPPQQQASPQPQFGGPPPQQQQPYSQQHQEAGYGFGGRDERTAAFPGLSGGAGEDLGSTIALPQEGAPRPQQGYGQAPPGYNPPAPGYGQQPPAISYGLPPGAYAPMAGPQSQIETALSLPRPDPAALWLAQQEKQKGERRNTGLFVAVVALTALCVIVSAALIYLKFKGHAAPAAAADSSAPVATGAAPPPAPSVTATAAAAPTAEAAPSASASAAASATASAAPEKPEKPEPAAAPAPAPKAERPAAERPSKAAEKPAAAEKEEPGFLTIVCNPYCDDVTDGGRSLGPSPIVHLSVKPGQHRITLKKDGSNKVISVIVVSGQVTAQRVSMAK
jgi:serine/threonine-protein kinase